MKLLIGLVLVASTFTLVHAQSTSDILVGGGFDLVKTDNEKVFKKAQLGFEANYFVVRHFAVGGGAELWTNHQTSSFVMGMRWYADENIFLRLRGLIGANDAAFGIGWSKPIATRWRFEAIGDFYFKGDFGVRTGIAYVIR